MPERYAAFVSYAHRYQQWVAALQDNLEACLRAAGAEVSEIFLDQVDLGSGRSWVAQLQEGLASSDQLILVATPEALASPRVEDEWNAFVTLRRDWAKGKLHVVSLVDTPLPPFLEGIERLDFVDHDDARYREGLRQLVGGLLGREPRQPPVLPEGVSVPLPPADVLPAVLRSRLVEWLAYLVKGKTLRLAVATALDMNKAVLVGHATPEATASAAIVAATGDDDRVEAGNRIVRALRDAFEEEDAELLAGLDRLGEELSRLRAGGGGGLLAAWLGRVYADHSNLVPFFEHADLELLDRVYVQLGLRPEEPWRRGGDETALALEPQLTIRDLLALDGNEHRWVTRRWVVLGDPGAGKTTLLRHLAARLAGEPRRRWVPVFETLPRLMRKPEWLLDRLERETRKTGVAAQGLAATLDREGQEGRLLLLLDGFDEVPRDDREDAEALLRQISKRWPATPLVVTSRPIGYRRPSSEFVELELLAFDEGQRRQFLEQWFRRGSGKTAEAAAVLATLAQDAGLWDLAGNPLYLTLIALLFERGQSPARNRSRLYDQVFQLLLDGRHRPGHKPIACQAAVRALLRRLARDMTHDDRDAEPKAEIEARLYQDEFDKLCLPLAKVPAWHQSLAPFLDDLAEKTGILGPHDGPSADWRYWHRTFREALTAEQLTADLAAGGEEWIVDKAREVKGNEGRWGEPFALLVGQVEDPDTLVTSLAEANRELGLRAMATAQRLEDKTVRGILSLTDKWTERRDVFLQLPEVIDDPERALALVDQLRLRTSDGNDLYFLEETAEAIGQKWPGAERLAARLTERFFDHLPAPPGDLYRWVETPLDGRVELWREIPAGEGWIGSKDDEGADHERPRHRVRITRSFTMVAVPVTNAQYEAFDPNYPWWEWKGVTREELAHHPVVNLTWYAVTAYCRWLSRNGFAGARLPAEEEWEYGCRAGSETRYWNGDSEEDLAEVGWYTRNSQGRTHRVGEKPANPWGLYDVHGNVWEWTLMDLRSYEGREEGIKIDPSTDLAAARGVVRVFRGGGFSNGAVWSRAANRNGNHPRSEIWDRGFRVVLPGRPEL